MEGKNSNYNPIAVANFKQSTFSEFEIGVGSDSEDTEIPLFHDVWVKSLVALLWVFCLVCSLFGAAEVRDPIQWTETLTF